jgi:hypothetical protein
MPAVRRWLALVARLLDPAAGRRQRVELCGGSDKRVVGSLPTAGRLPLSG